MLPTEAFAEAVAFLRLFDLKALAVTNALCSSLAAKASSSIRWEEFPGFRFDIGNRWIQIYRRSDVPAGEGSFRRRFVANLIFPSENDTIEFVAAAFPNCIFEDVIISVLTSKRLIDAIGRVADSVIVNGALCPDSYMSPECSLNVLRKFRKVKALHLHCEVSDINANEIAKLLRGSASRIFATTHLTEIRHPRY